MELGQRLELPAPSSLAERVGAELRAGRGWGKKWGKKPHGFQPIST
jgi:hypothetical protein